jgi:hypothetical protein
MNYKTKKLTLFLAFLLTFTLSMLPMLSVSAAKNTAPIPTTKSVPRLIINGYYVVYTHPVAPYVDKNSRLMVPLEAIAEMLGMEYSFDKKEKSMTVSRDDTTLTFYAGKKQFKVNTEMLNGDTAPALQKGTYYVPLRLLINMFQLDVSNKNGLIAIQDEKAFTTGRYTYMLDDDRFGIQRSTNNNAIQPISFQFSGTRDIKGDPNLRMWKYDFQFELKNISGKNITANQEDFHPIYYFSNNSFSMDSDNPYDIGKSDRKRYSISKDKTLKIKTKDGTNGQLEVVLAIGRTLEPIPNK